MNSKRIIIGLWNYCVFCQPDGLKLVGHKLVTCHISSVWSLSSVGSTGTVHKMASNI